MTQGNRGFIGFIDWIYDETYTKHPLQELPITDFYGRSTCGYYPATQTQLEKYGKYRARHALPKYRKGPAQFKDWHLAAYGPIYFFYRKGGKLIKIAVTTDG